MPISIRSRQYGVMVTWHIITAGNRETACLITVFKGLLFHFIGLGCDNLGDLTFAFLTGDSISILAVRLFGRGRLFGRRRLFGLVLFTTRALFFANLFVFIAFRRILPGRLDSLYRLLSLFGIDIDLA